MREAASPALLASPSAYLRGGGVWSGRMPDNPRGTFLAWMASFIDADEVLYPAKPYDRVFVGVFLSDRSILQLFFRGFLRKFSAFAKRIHRCHQKKQKETGQNAQSP